MYSKVLIPFKAGQWFKPENLKGKNNDIVCLNPF